MIDHPAILDYWTGHERNGMKNQGVPLAPGNRGGVDREDNQENTLLRFFAGCEILSAKPQEFRHREIAPEATPDPPAPPVPDPPETEVHKPPTHKAIHCVLYYPNNYSGVDDAPNKNGGTVNAVYYLVNGVGAQKYIDLDETHTSTYLKAVDIPTQIDSKTSNSGYEINGNISIVEENLKPDYETIKKSYADPVSKQVRGQYLTDPSGNKQTVNYGGTTYTLAKIVGSQAMSMKGAATKSNLTGATHQWYRRRWYYRVDKAYENSRLSRTNSYLDTQSFELNGKGYEKVKSKEEIMKAFGLEEADENTKLISFADLFVALEGTKAESLLSGSFDKGNVEIVKNIMNDTERYKITSIKFEGHASYQGYTTSNNTLSSNRALTFKKWMQSKKFPSIDKATTGSKKESQKNNVDNA